MKKTKLFPFLFVLFIFSFSVFISGCLSSDSHNVESIDAVSFSSEGEMKEYFNSVYFSSQGNGNLERYYSNLYSGNVYPSRSEELIIDYTGYYAGNNTTSNTTPAESGISKTPPAGSYDYSDVSFVSRYSETNVQVIGVDETDIVKTDGKTIYYTPENYYPYSVLQQTDYRTGEVYYSYKTGEKTFSLNALPPEKAEILSEIEGSGEVYLINNTLITIHYNLIKGYDVTDPSSPKKLWEKQLWGYYTDSRVIDGKLYLVVVNHNIFYPMKYMGQAVDHEDVYYPTSTDFTRPQTDSIFYISEVDVQEGSFDQTVALIGSDSSIIYGSGNALYFTNYYTIDEDAMYLQYMKDGGADFYPPVKKEILEIVSYDSIRPYLRAWGIRDTISNYTSALTLEEQQVLFNSTHNDYLEYSSGFASKAERTSFTKINLDDFSFETGSVPGLLLNSFSMDEQDGYLRIASSASGNWMMRDSGSNSVYVLDNHMKLVGSLEGLAPGETIYSSRFVGDMLYLVTYRTIDPFFVIDLSNPQDPELLGELKIPGYSTYLHPINETAVIGLGKADNNSMKLALFDVSDYSKPVEMDSFVFDRSVYSAAEHDYHAFMWDGEKELLVLPTYEHAFVFKVDDSGIHLVLDDIHEDSAVSRTIYINDYFYTFSGKEVHIINQNTWETVKIIDIPQPEIETMIESLKGK